MPKVIAVTTGNPEFEKLISSLGYEIVGRILLGDKRNAKYFITRGKLQKLKEMVQDLQANKIIVDHVLRTSQWYNLEKEMGIEVMDKVRLIIEIFADRARSREAMLQVEYARLQYDIPHIKEIIHQIRSGEHPGWMGGGEYEIADYYEQIRRRMARIRRKIEKLKIQREVRRKMRKDAGYVLVGIAGYTNSGKSTLLKALSGRDVLIEERMFSTLSTRTSKLGREKILITDTVGFVEDMPPYLINAFEPTLEEIYQADIVILLLDGSDDVTTFKRKMNLVLDIIGGKIHGMIIPVINKIDIAQNIEEEIEIVQEIKEPVLISAVKGTGLDSLIEKIKKEAGIKTYEIAISPEENDVVEYIGRYGKILEIKKDSVLQIKFEMQESFANSLFSTNIFPQEMKGG